VVKGDQPKKGKTALLTKYAQRASCFETTELAAGNWDLQNRTVVGKEVGKLTYEIGTKIRTIMGLFQKERELLAGNTQTSEMVSKKGRT